MKTESLSNALFLAKRCCSQLTENHSVEQLSPIYTLIKECEVIIQKESERREKHLSGIEKARNDGIHFGRPSIPCSPEFLKLAYLQSKHMVTAAEAAEQLNIGRSTFNKMKIKYREELEQWKKQGK